MEDGLLAVPTLLEQIDKAAAEMQVHLVGNYQSPYMREKIALIRGNVTELQLALGEPDEDCHHMTRKRIGGDATFVTWKCLASSCGEEWTEARD